jgi:hypothetical protein
VVDHISVMGDESNWMSGTLSYIRFVDVDDVAPRLGPKTRKERRKELKKGWSNPFSFLECPEQTKERTNEWKERR